MRPQPISRFPANRLFQIISKHFRNFSFTRLLRFLCHQLKLSYTIPSAGFCQITIEHREVHHFRNALRTIQKGGFLPQKSSPVFFVSAGPLVSNQTDNHLFAFTLQLDNFACRRMFRNVISSEAGTDALEQFVQVFIFQRFIDLHRYITRFHNRSHPDQPFIIGIMRNHYDDSAIFLGQFQILFRILISHPLIKVFG